MVRLGLSCFLKNPCLEFIKHHRAIGKEELETSAISNTELPQPTKKSQEVSPGYKIPLYVSK